MTDFSKKSPEYIQNGYYRVNGIDFMSIWTFKNKNSKITTENTTLRNGNEGKELAQKCSQVFSTTPDFGSFKEILIFPVSELIEYYSSL